MSQDKDNTAREAGFVFAADQRIAGAVRVEDPAFIPKTPPAAVSRVMMTALADRISVDTLIHARALLAAVEHGISELRAGRLEGFIFCMIDLERASLEVGKTINQSAGSTYDSIKNLDPAYAAGCAPARMEGQIRRAMDNARHLNEMSLELSRALVPPDGPEAEAIRRLLAEKKGNR